MSELKPLEKEVTPDRIVDATENYSPIPLLRLKKELAVMSTAEIVRVDCTDPDSADDIASWCTRMNNTFLGEKKETLFTSFFIAKE